MDLNWFSNMVKEPEHQTYLMHTFLMSKTVIIVYLDHISHNKG